MCLPTQHNIIRRSQRPPTPPAGSPAADARHVQRQTWRMGPAMCALVWRQEARVRRPHALCHRRASGTYPQRPHRATIFSLTLARLALPASVAALAEKCAPSATTSLTLTYFLSCQLKTCSRPILPPAPPGWAVWATVTVPRGNACVCVCAVFVLCSVTQWSSSACQSVRPPTPSVKGSFPLA